MTDRSLTRLALVILISIVGFACSSSKDVEKNSTTAVADSTMKKSQPVPATPASVIIAEKKRTEPETDYSGREAKSSEAWVKAGIIYEVFVRDFSPEGTFAALQKRLPELKSLGVQTIWLMPIHPIGKVKRKGTFGSPYSIQDYYLITPDFGTKDDLRSLVQATHKLGMKLVIDLVVNHTAWDNPLVKLHPEWYKHDSTGKIVSPVANWYDVAGLDYSKPELQTYIIDMMKYWIREFDIDGYRCDVAEFIPTSFWQKAVSEIKKIKPSLMMLSEGSKPEQHLEAFDLTYSWNVYDALSGIAQGRRTVKDLDATLQDEVKRFPKNSLRMRFNTNHDKNAYDGPPLERYKSAAAAEVTAVAAFTIGGYETLRGVPMLYNGDEVAANVKLDLFEKIPVIWSGKNADAFRTLYTKLGDLRAKHAAVALGDMTRLKSSDDERLFAFERSLLLDGDSEQPVKKTKKARPHKDRVLVLMNLSNSKFDGYVKVDKSRKLTDCFDTERHVTTKDGNLKLSLPAWGYKIYSYN
jgi:cyclomaltodextrinase